jgi:hypothetical protein
MYQFAHLADIHLGAAQEPTLAQLEIEAFLRAMDTCIDRNVDFVLICGDLFQTTLPSDLRVVKQAAEKMREVHDQGIPIYAIYGSHDYTPTGTSIIDVIEGAGLMTKIVRPRVDNGKLTLDYVEDGRTGAKLVGISARKMGLERKYYEILDREALERIESFKIFAFHSGLDEFKPGYLSAMETIPLSLLPKGFNYYAGGHIHQKSVNHLPGYDPVVFPGPLFLGNARGRDLESAANGEERGFYIVSFDEDVSDIEFVETHLIDGIYREFNVSGLNASKARTELTEELSKLDVRDKMVVLKIKGELAGGKTADIDFPSLRNLLSESGATSVHLNRFGLTSKEYAAIKVRGEDRSVIEERLFKENIGTVKVSIPALQNTSGVALSLDLFKSLKTGKGATETKTDYEQRLRDEGIDILSLSEALEN